MPPTNTATSSRLSASAGTASSALSAERVVEVEVRPAEQGRQQRHVPGDRREVRQQEPPVAVEHAQAPRAQHQERRHRERQPDDADGQLEPVDDQRAGRDLLGVAQEARRDDGHERLGEEHAQDGRRRRDGRQQAEDGAGEPARVLLPPLLQHPAVDRDERRRERPLPQQVLQEVGRPQRQPVDVGEGAGAEKVGDRAVADEPDHAAGEDAGRDQQRPGPVGRRARVLAWAARRRAPPRP